MNELDFQHSVDKIKKFSKVFRSGLDIINFSIDCHLEELDNMDELPKLYVEKERLVKQISLMDKLDHHGKIITNPKTDPFSMMNSCGAFLKYMDDLDKLMEKESEFKSETEENT